MAARPRRKDGRRRTEPTPNTPGRGRRRPPETAASNLVVGLRPVLEALRANRRLLRRVYWRRGTQAPRPALVAVLDLAAELRIPVEGLTPDDFERRVGKEAPTHQGVALDAGGIPTLSLQELPAVFARAQTLVALDGVEDPHNLGAIARVAVAAGADGLILPKRRCAPLGAATSRASAGALEHLPTAIVANLREAITRLQGMGFLAIGADPAGEASLYDESRRHRPDGAKSPRVLVLGGEGAGIRPALRRALDERIQIPMAHRIGSLNVSTAAAVVLFEWRRAGGSQAIPRGEEGQQGHR